MKKRLADYLVERLPELTGSRHSFFLSGGGIMYLTDALGKSRRVTPVAMHHEQSAAIAADAYGRVNNTVGILFVTSGPGGTNAVTGVAGAWLESTPLLVISGQVSRANRRHNSPVRQMGFQEIDIIPIVKPITKYACTILEPEIIRYHLEKAVYLSRTGRPGPVWLDIPLDVQNAEININRLKGFNPSSIAPVTEPHNETDKKINRILELLAKSKRPLLLGGGGIFLSGAKKEFIKLVNTLEIPTQLSWNGIDLIEEAHPLFFGRHNSYGPRYPNFIVQNCDLLISIGSRLGLQQIGFNYKSFARGARKVVVDIDRAELKKHTVKADIPVQADAGYFIETLLQKVKSAPLVKPDIKEWVMWCNEKKKRFPVCPSSYYKNKKYVDPYVFSFCLSEVLPEGALIMPGSSGTCFTVMNQVFKIKKKQRFFTSKGLAAMGYGLPSSIGGCFAGGRRDTVTVIGDGGFQLNIQELQTVAHYRLPIKIFILNNEGYLSIRTTQLTYFNGRFVGSGATSGVSLPSLRKIANAYGMPYRRIKSHARLKNEIKKTLKTKGPVICEVMVNPKKALLPKLASYKKADGDIESRPLEDMVPLLPRKELYSSMIIRPWKK
ncbi:MAG: thiamine pyrophosphate-binding protein [Candidatus Omnitrophica bacterium]|nr:thiamine pyrophosphate-binding protein [Candidatus Omnitrophota bacterium]